MSSSMKVSALLVSLLLLDARLHSQDRDSQNNELPSFRIYDVADLLTRPTDFRAAGVLGVRRIEPVERQGADGDGAGSAARLETQSERLAELIEASLSAEGSRDLRMHDGRLLVSAGRDAHDELERFLGDLRRDRALRAQVEAAVIPVSEEALAELPPSLTRGLRRAAFEGVLPHAVRVTEAEMDALLASLPEEPSAEVVLPRMEPFNHQVSYCSVVTQDRLVTDVRIARHDGTTTAEPVLGILNTGTVVQFQPAVSSDRNVIALGLRVETAKRRSSKVVPARELERFKGVPEVGDLTVEIPELERRTIETTVSLQAGAWFLVGSLRSDDAHESAPPQAVLIRATVVE